MPLVHKARGCQRKPRKLEGLLLEECTGWLSQRCWPLKEAKGDGSCKDSKFVSSLSHCCSIHSILFKSEPEGEKWNIIFKVAISLP
jgi:hypothetical protein